MPLVRVDHNKHVRPLKFEVEGLAVQGFLNILGALSGTGKTAVLTGIAAQASRPNGGELAGYQIHPTPSIYLDFDAPGDGRNTSFWFQKHQRAYRDIDRNLITVLEPDARTPALNTRALEDLTAMAQTAGARLIIIDSFMAAFPTVDPVRASAVLGPMTMLRKLAHETDAAVIVVDHLPKPMFGERAGARGVLGSVAKTAQARSVHILTDVPKDKTNGARVLQWRCDKMSFARKPEPFGLEMIFDNGGIRFEPHDLPEQPPTDKRRSALDAMTTYLEDHIGQTVPRRDLINHARMTAHSSERTAERALTDLTTMLGSRIHTTGSVGRGQPTNYRLLPIEDLAANNRNTVGDNE